MFCAYVQKEGIEQLVSGNLWDVEPVGIQDHGTCSKFLDALASLDVALVCLSVCLFDI